MFDHLLDRGCIRHESVHQLLAERHKLIDKLMLDLLPEARKYSRAPVSNFQVGAVARGASGALYLGANLEIPGESLGQTVHAEQAAVANAFMNDDDIVSIAVTATPCGHCRQFLHEMSGGRRIQILTAGSPAADLEDLLPHAFDLGFPARVPWTFEVQGDDELVRAATIAARRAHAPYSKSPSGVAIRSQRGEVYSGTYLENAAFNPSLSPLQVAL